MSNKHFNQKVLAASLVAVSLAVGLTQLPQVQAVLPVAVKTQKAEATAPEEFYTIRTQADLDKFLKLSDDVRNNFNGFKFENKGTITFPANYQLNVMRFVRFWLSDKSTGTIDFNNTIIAINRHAKGSVRPADGHAYWPVVGTLHWYVSGDHHNQIIKNLDVHGSVVTKYANGKVSDDGQGGMQVILLHAKNINFQNMQFHQAQIFDRHVFDSLGSKGITWDNCKFYGYGGSNFTQNTWNNIYKLESNPSAGVKGHSVLSEAIQLDVATVVGASHDPEVNKTNFPSAGSTIFDGASTENATIKNCYFGPEINGVSVLRESELYEYALYQNLQLRIPYTGNILVGNDFIWAHYVHMGLQRPWAYQSLFELVIEEGILLDVIDHSGLVQNLRNEIEKNPKKFYQNLDQNVLEYLEKNLSTDKESLTWWLDFWPE